MGITGSVGKTSTKDFLAAVLSTTYRTAASERSFNNELGVPLTLANAAAGTQATIVEMGARGLGHIRLLCGVATPTVGVVTTVTGAHLEQFGSLDDIAEAKGELVASLPESGCAVFARGRSARGGNGVPHDSPGPDLRSRRGPCPGRRTGGPGRGAPRVVPAEDPVGRR